MDRYDQDSAEWREDLIRFFLKPYFFMTLILLVLVFFPIVGVNVPKSLFQFVMSAFRIAFVATCGWFLIRGVYLLEKVFTKHFNLDSSDNLRARKIQTQFLVFKRLLIILVFIVAFCFVLMGFENFRRIGSALLASVGIAGVIIGLAAQKTVGTLFAGIHLAISQPIRMDDVLIVEGEWGRVEEITFTYVVLKIWDSRRLILPTTYFLEKPFQNWTRTSADLLAYVYIYADYTLSIDQMRKVLTDILEQSEWWDHRVNVLQVVDCTEKTMQLRALMSASNSSDAWELRCEVREQLLVWMQNNVPEALPRFRIESFLEKEEGAAL